MGDKVEIVKLNIDENPETARAYRVMSVPTLTVFKGGEPVQSVAGAKPKGDLVKLIESASLTRDSSDAPASDPDAGVVAHVRRHGSVTAARAGASPRVRSVDSRPSP